MDIVTLKSSPDTRFQKFAALFTRIKNLILSPKTEWAEIAAEEPDAKSVFTSYALPVTLVLAVIVFIGYAFIWRNGLGEVISFMLGFYFSFQTAFIGVVGVWLAAVAINELAPKFGAEKNMGRAMQLVAYSVIPAMALVGSWWLPDLLFKTFPLQKDIIVVFPPIGIIVFLFFELYGLYQFNLGFPLVMKTPQNKMGKYKAISVVIVILMSIALAFIFRYMIWDMIEHIKISARPDK